MFDLGFFELLVVGIVALIVVGPKDLPVMFRTVGQFTGKARAMAREFTSAMNQAADESGMRDIQKDLRTIANPKKAGMSALKDAADSLTDWDPEAAAETAASTPAKASKPDEGPETAAMRAKHEEVAAAARARAEAIAEAGAEPKPTAAPAETAAPKDNT